MKSIILILMSLVFGITHSQNKEIQGVVKDFDTQLPIEEVSLSTSSNIFSMSNTEGAFLMIVPKHTTKIVFSHMFYQSYILELDNKTNKFEILLKPESYTLDEMVINPISAKEILSKATKNSIEKLEKSILLKTYFREFINSSYGIETANTAETGISSFSDGLLDYHIKKNGSSDLYINQSRALNADTLRSKESSFIDVRKITNLAYEMEILNYILKSNNYDFLKEYKTDSNDRGIFFISIKPKKDVQEVLYEGIVSIDDETNKILEVDLKTSEAHFNYAKNIKLFGMEVKRGRNAVKLSFMINKDIYYPYYIRAYSQNFLGLTSKGSTTFINMESSSDLVVTEFATNVSKINNREKFRSRTLFNAGKNYTEDYWKTHNTLLLTENEQKILEAINQN